MRQFKHPTPLNFFKVPFESAVASARVLSEMLKATDVPSNKEMLDSARVNLGLCRRAENSPSKALTPTR